MESLDEKLINACDLFQDDGIVKVTENRLQAFLQMTESVSLSTAERLRQLAIHLQHEEFESGWRGFRQIFVTAASREPNDWKLYHSWGIIAMDYSQDWREQCEKRRLDAANEAESVFHQALEISPDNSDISYALGLLYYNHPLFDENRIHYLYTALQWFTQAVEENPDNVMAQLYKAHCYHDLEDWRSAIASYSAVDQQHLLREWPVWRTIKLREQLAFCYAKAGEIEESSRQFLEFLDYVEGLSEEALEEEIVNIDELVMAAQELLNSPTLLARTRQLIVRIGFEKRYEL